MLASAAAITRGPIAQVLEQYAAVLSGRVEPLDPGGCVLIKVTLPSAAGFELAYGGEASVHRCRADKRAQFLARLHAVIVFLIGIAFPPRFDVSQYFAQSSMSRRRLSKRSPRR